MPSITISNRTLDARPDRIDYRDRPYQPPLLSLPESYPDAGTIETHMSQYASTLILDQGSEGACTGFGLAALINYLLYRKGLESDSEVECVSPRMLYQLARIYDEWAGEDYEGSSCRGAMKGWHRHGVCSEEMWRYRDKNGNVQFLTPEDGWQQNAASRPLGAYYRINKDSVVDMQAAIHEVGAIYASASVHKGWMLGPKSSLPLIPHKPGITGGHAFAIVGYTLDGFIVQNSWGADWGFSGFAVLPYADWVQHGSDVWVGVLGAPTAIPKEQAPDRSIRSVGLRDVVDNKAAWFWRSDATDRTREYRNKAVEPLSEGDAYNHTIVLGNNGRPLNRYIDAPNATAAVEQAAFTLPFQWLQGKPPTKIVIYAHGGLNDEGASLKRIRVMAPYFRENAIYPIFVTWRTGFRDSISGMIEDAALRVFTPEETGPARGWISDLRQQIREARDRSIEVACEKLIVKAIWGQMKQNARASASTGLFHIADHLQSLATEIDKLEIHLVGHSAGAYLLGYLLDLFAKRNLSATTCTLFAPACTVDFAIERFGTALKNKAITSKDGNKGRLYFDILSDERERADSVGPYGKSLLYLVSRALEDVHKMPLLGMEAVWSSAAESDDMWNPRTNAGITGWRKIANGLDAAKGDRSSPSIHKKERVSNGRSLIPLAHGSFDNDVKVITKTLERIRGSKLVAKVESLEGF